MLAVHIVAQADLPGSALPAWLTLAAGAIALIAIAARTWIRRSPRNRALALASVIPLAGVLVVGAVYLGTDAGSTTAETQETVPASENIDIQLPTLSFSE